MARVLLLLPVLDFDPSEAAVSWQVLVNAGHVVRFATPGGRPAVADDIMLTGRGLDLWGQIPLLRNLPLLGFDASESRRQAHAKMIVDPNYVAPQRWDAIDPMAFDALLLHWGSSCTWLARLPARVQHHDAFAITGRAI
jgi:putative intracellular protease/amidase